MYFKVASLNPDQHHSYAHSDDVRPVERLCIVVIRLFSAVHKWEMQFDVLVFIIQLQNLFWADPFEADIHLTNNYAGVQDCDVFEDVWISKFVVERLVGSEVGELYVDVLITDGDHRQAFAWITVVFLCLRIDCNDFVAAYEGDLNCLGKWQQ